MSKTQSGSTPLTDGKERDVSADSGQRLATSRRRLLTGSAAIPVLMTLPTNASAVAFGSTLRCLTNQTTQPTDFFTPSPNGWATQPLSCFQVSLPSGADPRDIGDYGANKYYDRAGLQWYADGDRFRPVGTSSGSGYVVRGRATAYTYIYVGQDGSYWGVDPAYRARGGLAVYGSCYASIMGAA